MQLGKMSLLLYLEQCFLHYFLFLELQLKNHLVSKACQLDACSVLYTFFSDPFIVNNELTFVVIQLTVFPTELCIP